MTHVDWRSVPPACVARRSRGTVRCRNDRDHDAPARRPLHRTVGHPQGGSAAAHRSRAVRRRRRRSLACCTPRSCAARSRSATITQPRHQRRHGSCRASSPCTRGRTSTAASARRGTRCSARSCRCPAAARDQRRPPRRRADRARRRREPLRRRGRVRADRGRVRAEQAVVDFATAADDTEHLVHGAWGFPSNAMVEVPFTPMSRDLDEAFAAARARRRVHDPAEPLHLRADGEAGDRRLVGPRPRRDGDHLRRRQAVHETRNFFARYLGIPEGNVTRHRPRCRRWIRAEDVRVPRGMRGRARVTHARPAREVDRGPAREPHRRRRTPATSSARCAWPSTATASSRRSPSSTWPTSAPTRRARR